MTHTFELPLVGEHGFAFPLPYGCGERSGFGKERCWRLAHHRGMHRNLDGTHRWQSTEWYVLKDPSVDDKAWIRALASLFRPRTRRDFADLRCPLERGHS